MSENKTDLKMSGVMGSVPYYLFQLVTLLQTVNNSFFCLSVQPLVYKRHNLLGADVTPISYIFWKLNGLLRVLVS